MGGLVCVCVCLCVKSSQSKSPKTIKYFMWIFGSRESLLVNPPWSIRLGCFFFNMGGGGGGGNYISNKRELHQ